MKALVAALFVTIACAIPAAFASGALQVAEAKLGKGVKDRMITDETTTFAVGERVYLWVRLTGGPSDPIKVTWTIGDFSDADIGLTVGAASWRTWSYKTAFKAGEWTVTVSDNAGAPLKELKFTVK